jgi:hypothetical protein
MHYNWGPGRNRTLILFLIIGDLIQVLQFMTHSCVTDPLVHCGQHFGQAIHALCNVQALLMNGLLQMGELADMPEESFTAE